VVATNRKHPKPAVRCRGNLRRSGRRGCQAISDVDEPLLAPLPDIDEQQSSFD